MGNINLNLIILALLALLFIFVMFSIFLYYNQKKCVLDAFINIKDEDFVLKILSLKHVLENIVNNLSNKYVGKRGKIDGVEFKKDFETMMIKLERSLYEFFSENPKIDRLEVCKIFESFVDCLSSHFIAHLDDIMSEDMLCSISNIIKDTRSIIFEHVTNGYEGTVISEVNQKKKQETIAL